jgi:hypothetical protein
MSLPEIEEIKGNVIYAYFPLNRKQYEASLRDFQISEDLYEQENVEIPKDHENVLTIKELKKDLIEIEKLLS